MSTQPSANLTDTARQASRQINYAWYADLPADDPLLGQVLKDYEAHTSHCTLFMRDLTELFRRQPEMPRDRLVEVWLKTGAVDEEELESRRIFEEISSGAATFPGDERESIVTVKLPETPVNKKRIERLLAPLDPSTAQNQIHVNGSRYIRYVHETHGIPYLRLDKEASTITLGFEGSLDQLAELPSDPATVSQGLAHIEQYLSTVDTGQSANPQFAKMSMFESLLYVFTAPFLNEYMRDRRERFGIIDTRGPRFLYIYGPTQNGKSTFLLFALKLLTGQNVRPLSRGDFTKTKILNASIVGTVFPLVFDDITVGQSPGIEEVFKSYWERWWRDDFASPQIIMTSNTPRLRDWAKSRTKRADFDVHFAPTEHDKEKLNQLFQTENRVFRWFSYSYLQKLRSPDPPSDDELYLARAVVTDLYEFAGRQVPDYFPTQPLEKIYDPGHRDWRDLLYGIEKATTADDQGRLPVRFSSDLQH